MPVKKTVSNDLINELQTFIAKHLEPADNPSSITKRGYDWFYDYFDFITEDEIRNQLAQAFYQSRYVHKLLTALKLKGKELYPFILLELFEYASIFEALTDYVIEKCFISDTEFEKLRAVEELKKLGELNPNNGKVILEKDCDNKTEIVFACYKTKQLQLRDIRFSYRIEFLAKRIGLSELDTEKIKAIYDERNHIHLLKAAADSFVPDSKETAKAFKTVRKFIEIIRKYLG